MFYPPQPSYIAKLSSQFRKLETDPSWIAEPSMRGMRCLAHHHHGRIDLWTRDLHLISAPLVETRKQIIAMIPDGTILDGVLFWPGHGKILTNYFVFDIPQYKNKGTGQLFERYNLLRNLNKNLPLIRITEHDQAKNKLLIYYESIKLPEVKGIILKDLTSMYPNASKSKSMTDSWIEVTK